MNEPVCCENPDIQQRTTYIGNLLMYASGWCKMCHSEWSWNDAKKEWVKKLAQADGGES